jgi:hypothetical protein
MFKWIFKIFVRIFWPPEPPPPSKLEVLAHQLAKAETDLLYVVDKLERGQGDEKTLRARIKRIRGDMDEEGERARLKAAQVELDKRSGAASV